MINNGSEWRKWDLHVHTPASIVHEYKKGNYEDIWERYIDELEKLPSDIKVLGINDYWFLDGYKKIKEYKESGHLSNIDLILPVIEFRLRDFVGSSKLNKINYHIIFSDKLTIEEIEEEFLKRLEIKNFENRFLSKENLINFGKQERENTPDNKKSNLPSSNLEIGFNNFTISLDIINNLLKKDYFKNKVIRAIGKTEWDSFKWEASSSDKKELINNVDFVFSASPTVKNALQSKEKLIEQKVNDCLLHCSDAHQFYNDMYTSKVLGHCYTWIKSDTTFEGLKQVIYEPEYRVKIQEIQPPNPIHKLEEIELSFNKNVKWGNDTFCFAGFDKPIKLSPYLTCIIGGRGSGKSTLLNLVAEKIDKETNDFFKDLTEKDRKSFVKFIPEIVENIEFLAQNTIEKFATDNEAFTEAIFKRLDRNSSAILSNSISECNQEILKFDEYIELLKNRKNLHNKLIKEKEDLKRDEHLIKAFQEQEYLEPKSKLQSVQQKINELSNSRKIYKNLFDNIKNIVDANEIIKETKNDYEIYFNNLYNEIQQVYSKYSEPKQYDIIKKKISDLEEESKEYSKKIESYLIKKGMSPENIHDAKNASTNIENIKHKIKELKSSLLNIKKEKKKFSTDVIDTKLEEFKNLINNELNIINDMFKTISDKNPSEIKSIKVMYSLNTDIFDKVFSSFISTLELDSEISSSRKKIKEYLSAIPIEEVLLLSRKEEFLDKVGHKGTEAYKIIEKIFLDGTNFEIYKVMIRKYKRDLENNKVLTVYYDEKTLDNSSFGQKCTAAIVVLLSLGNNPIIIDEPEAHLDSSLIANYLVELIKEQKQKRQIIFATHNANFVLNADAELIIKLENTAGKTNVTHFTIEDLNHREDLLKLEGGKVAFQKRERKYNI